MERGSWTGSHAVLTAGVTVGAGAAVAADAVLLPTVVANRPCKVTAWHGQNPHIPEGDAFE
jgi:acetyltransferase-like isoleucine patch superfamily enzyme